MKSWTAFNSSLSTGTFCSSACRCYVAAFHLKPWWDHIVHAGNVYLATEGSNSTRGRLIHFDWDEEVEDQRGTGQWKLGILSPQFNVWQEIRWQSWHVFPKRVQIELMSACVRGSRIQPRAQQNTQKYVKISLYLKGAESGWLQEKTVIVVKNCFLWASARLPPARAFVPTACFYRSNRSNKHCTEESTRGASVPHALVISDKDWQGFKLLMKTSHSLARPNSVTITLKTAS